MNNTIVFGDLHIKKEGLIDKPVIELIKSLSINYKRIVFAGDVFDNFDISVKDNLFYEFLSNIEKEVIILAGNHDFSQGRCGLQVAHQFSKNVHVVKDYEFFDYKDVRLHLLNYFRYKGKFEFDLAKDKKNILISHCDLVVNNPIKEFEVFDYVINGHIHDTIFNAKKNIINIGAVRQCNSAENQDKMFISFNTSNFNGLEFTEFKSPVEYKKIFSNQIDGIKKIEKNTIITLMTKPLEDYKELLSEIQKKEWYDENRVLIKQENYVSETSVQEFIQDIKTEFVKIDNVLDKYFEFYKDKFKIKEDFSQYKKVFDKLFSQFSEKDNDFFNNYNIMFKSIKANNFKLYKDFEYTFDNFKGITAINGFNYDEINDEGELTSNEAGKSCIRNMIEYALTGDDKPLRYGEKKGNVELNLKINVDEVIIKREYTASQMSLRIEINSKEEWKDETNTNKMKMFFDKYKIENALQFILINDTGKIKFFFSSRSSERVKIFKDMFPIITFVSAFIDYIKDIVKTKDSEVNKVKDSLDNLINLRNSIGKTLWDRFFNIQSNIEINSNFDNIENEIKDLEKKIDNDLIGKKIEFTTIKNIINDNPNILKISNIYDSKHKEGINKYFDFKKLNSEYEIKKNNLLNLENNLKENQGILDNYNKELINHKKSIENIDMNIDINYLNNVSDLLKIKDVIKKSEWYEEDFLIYLSDNEGDKKDLTIKINNISNERENKRKEYRKIEDEIKNLKNSITSGICYACGQEIGNSKKINDEISIKEIELSKVAEEGKKLKSELDKLENHLESINSLLNKKNSMISILNTNNVSKELFEKYISDYINNKLDIDLSGWSVEKINECKKDIEKYNEISSLIKQIEFRLIPEIKSKIEGFENNIDILKKELAVNIERYPEFIDDLLKDLEAKSLKIENYYNAISNIEYILKTGLYKKIDESILTDINNNLENIVTMEGYVLKLNDLNNDYKNKKLWLQKAEEEKELIIKEIKDNQKKYNKDKVKKEYNELLKDFNLHGNLKDILCQKKSVTFERFFISIFYDKVKEIYNTMLKIVFTRDIILNIDENDFVFKDKNGNEMSYNTSFSNGAKTKLESIMIFTNNLLFNQFGVDSNIMFIDEFLDKGLDNVNLNRVLNILKIFFKNKNCFVISHKSIEENVDRTISVTRKDNVSQIS